MLFKYTETLKVVDSETLEENQITQCSIDNRTIFSKDLDAKIKFGDKIIKTYSDGYTEEFRVRGVSKLFNGVISIQI